MFKKLNVIQHFGSASPEQSETVLESNLLTYDMVCKKNTQKKWGWIRKIVVVLSVQGFELCILWEGQKVNLNYRQMPLFYFYCNIKI